LTVHGDLCTAGYEAHANFVDELICLLANNVLIEVVTIHRPYEMLKFVSIYTQTFLSPAEEVLIYSMKLQFPNEYFREGVTIVNFVLQTTPEEKHHKD
jgi:hypothetical protein